MFDIFSKRKVVIGGAIILGAAALFVVLNFKSVRPSEEKSGLVLPEVKRENVKTGSTDTEAGASTESAAQVKKPVPPYTGEAVQDLAADQNFVKQVPKDVYEKSTSELKDLAVELASNPNQPALWMRVAYLKHFYNNDIGARDAYEYLNKIGGGDAIPHYNLALIYGYNLKEPQKAVEKFKAAIERDPRSSIYRIGFADFYREVMRDLPSAEKTLLDGLAILKDTNYYIALGSLEKAMGKLDKSIMYYELALADRSLPPPTRTAINDEVVGLKRMADGGGQ